MAWQKMSDAAEVKSLATEESQEICQQDSGEKVQQSDGDSNGDCTRSTGG